jgi:hypothetical protein
MRQPVGVVGVIVSWNYPIFLSCGPLTFFADSGGRGPLFSSPPFGTSLLDRVGNDRTSGHGQRCP